MAIEPASSWERFMSDARERVRAGVPLETRGTLTRLTGLVLEAAGIRVPVGSQCMVQMPQKQQVSKLLVFSQHYLFSLVNSINYCKRIC